MIYLDNAATTGKKPPLVINAVNNALKYYCVNPGRSGHSLSIKASEKIYNTRVKTSNFFGFDKPENVVFTLNCTHSLNIVLKGLLSEGDHALISNLEHNAVVRPLMELNKNYGVQFDVFNAFAEDLILELKSKLRPNTKIIVCTHVSNVCGHALPIEKIGEFAKENGILFCVDAAQSAGVLPINILEMNIDYLCVAAHKGLYAPMGLGLLIISGKKPKTLVQGGTGTNSIDLMQPADMPESFESGTVNLPAILGLSAGLDFVKIKGLKQILNHEKVLCERFYNSLKNNDNIIFYAYSSNNAPVISFNVRNFSSEEVGAFLNKNNIAVRTGLHCAPFAHKTLNTLKTGTVRISPSVYNNIAEIDKTISLLKSIY